MYTMIVRAFSTPDIVRFTAMKNIVRVRVDERVEGGWPLSDEPYSDREDEVTTIVGVRAVVTPVPDSEFDKKVEKFKKQTAYRPLSTIDTVTDGGVQVGDTVHTVIVRYDSGDTFGVSLGLHTVYDVFGSRDEADRLASAIRNIVIAEAREGSRGELRKWDFNYNGTSYHKCWVGYFESFVDVEVYSLMVEGDGS